MILYIYASVFMLPINFLNNKLFNNNSIKINSMLRFFPYCGQYAFHYKDKLEANIDKILFNPRCSHFIEWPYQL